MCEYYLVRIKRLLRKKCKIPVSLTHLITNYLPECPIETRMPQLEAYVRSKPRERRFEDRGAGETVRWPSEEETWYCDLHEKEHTLWCCFSENPRDVNLFECTVDGNFQYTLE